MNLKKSYKEQYGYTRVVTDRNSPLTYEELDFLMLADGQSFTVHERGKEFVLMLLYGSCKVESEGFCFEKVGKRKNVFEGAADAVYIGKDTDFTVTGVGGDVKIAVCKAPAERFYPAKHIVGSELPMKTFGKGAYVRDVAINYTEADEGNLLYIGEFWVENGSWASFPPHKHDVENGKEATLDEIYYFEFDKPQGFGFQAVYTKDGEIDEVYRVKSGDMVEVPKGYHPFTVAPGYKNYCLWIMAGPRRGLLSSPDEEHVWMNK